MCISWKCIKKACNKNMLQWLHEAEHLGLEVGAHGGISGNGGKTGRMLEQSVNFRTTAFLLFFLIKVCNSPVQR